MEPKEALQVNAIVIFFWTTFKIPVGNRMVDLTLSLHIQIVSLHIQIVLYFINIFILKSMHNYHFLSEQCTYLKLIYYEKRLFMYFASTLVTLETLQTDK